jgi:hypothetical protein
MIVVDVVVCRSCGRLDSPARIRTFRLAIDDLRSPTLARHAVGATVLCEPCWRRLTGLPARAAA